MDEDHVYLSLKFTLKKCYYSEKGPLGTDGCNLVLEPFVVTTTFATSFRVVTAVTGLCWT